MYTYCVRLAWRSISYTHTKLHSWQTAHSPVPPVLLVELLFPDLLRPGSQSPLFLSSHLGLVLWREGAKSHVFLPLTKGTAEERIAEATLRYATTGAATCTCV